MLGYCQVNAVTTNPGTRKFNGSAGCVDVDDLAKVPGKVTPSLAYFAAKLTAVAELQTH